MSNNPSFLFHRNGLIKVFVPLILSLFLLARMSNSQAQMPQDGNQEAILQGSLHIEPLQALLDDPKGKIQPGSSIKIVVTVENTGKQTSPPGQLYVRYALAHPLEREAKSIIFETEKKLLPAIEPGQQVNIAFETHHHIPSVLDFVRYDWSMREYQAIAVIHEKDYLIGTLALTFSAYYYPGIKKQFPIKISPDNYK